MYFIIIAIVVFIDQLTKYLIQGNMVLNTSVPIIDGIFHITYIHNHGAAFSLFENKTSFLIFMQVIIIAIILTFLLKKHKTEHWSILLSISLIAAGGIGNLIDRSMTGYVVDFFDFRIWPIFNIADISVCCGCFLLVFYMFLVEPKKIMAKKHHSIQNDSQRRIDINKE